MAEKVSAKTAWALAKAIKGAASSTGGSSTQTATFIRKDTDGTCWVRFAGNDFDTPVNGCALADAEPGQTVQCAIDGTTMTMVGNTSDPAVGGKSVAKTVERVRKTLSRSVESAQRVADAAQVVANAINQHFWHDDNGAHVTMATQEDWDTNHSGPNSLWNSLGMLFRDGLNNLLTLTTQDGARALTIWDGLGNTAGNIRAIIGEVVQLGSTASGNYMTLDDSGVEIYNEDKTDGYSAKIGATFAEFLGGLLKLEYDVEGTSSDPIYASDIRHTAPNKIGSLGFLEFKTYNAGKSNEKTVASIVADEVNFYGQLTGSVSTAFDVSTVQLMEGTVTIAAGGSTSTSTTVGTHGVGWYPLGIVGWACSYGEITLARCRISNATEGDATIEYVAHNTGTTARKPNLNVRVLWVRMGDY